MKKILLLVLLTAGHHVSASYGRVSQEVMRALIRAEIVQFAAMIPKPWQYPLSSKYREAIRLYYATVASKQDLQARVNSENYDRVKTLVAALEHSKCVSEGTVINVIDQLRDELRLGTALRVYPHHPTAEDRAIFEAVREIIQ